MWSRSMSVRVNCAATSIHDTGRFNKHDPRSAQLIISCDHIIGHQVISCARGAWQDTINIQYWRHSSYHATFILSIFPSLNSRFSYAYFVPILHTQYLKITCLTKTKLRHVTRVWSRLSARCCCYHLQHPSCGRGHTSHPVFVVTPCVVYNHPVYVVTPGCSDTACVVFISTTVTSVSEIFTFYSLP